MYNKDEPSKLYRLWMTTFGESQKDDNFTENEIREKLDAVLKLYEFANKVSVSEDEYNITVRELCTQLRIKGMGKGTPVIDPNTFSPWLRTRDDINSFYWNRYRNYLIESKCWNSNVVDSLGIVNNEILDMLGNPANINPWKRHGLVMGDVQSGKTANYTALCNKAMDSGYRVIIILAGSQENLRQQTQKRLDKELVGLDSQYLFDKLGRKLPIGVGVINPGKFVTTFTSKDDDFDRKMEKSLGLRLKTNSEPALFVVKKQKQRLDYLAKWLRKHNANSDGLIDEPMLLIDDEADNASVNTREDNPTTINKCIRKLLGLFTRTSYVGYTATPYANIFIDPDTDDKVLKSDLFPSDFIYPLRAPSNYIGNTAIFGDDARYGNMLVEIDDAEECIPIKHKCVDDINSLPESLFDAMRYFFLANAIMDAQGVTTNHRSMLINISRLTNVHEYILYTTKEYLKKMKSEILSYSALETQEACKVSTIRALKDTWERHKMESISPVGWEVLQQKYLNSAVKNIDAIQVNQRTGAASLDYDKFKEAGLRVIAIGGNSLSRGLTLEGLCVSYFYRNSRMYDTLLQMGRWFGYRDGYDSLCRIWMSDEAIESFSHITRATTELRDELRYMYNNKMTPKEFGLMIRSKPEAVDIIEKEREKNRMKYNLMVAAKNKMKTATEIIRVISVRGDLIETPKILNDISRLVDNYKHVTKFIDKVENYLNKDKDIYDGNHMLWVNVPVGEIAELIRSFSADPFSSTFQPEFLADYIENDEELSLWDVAVPEGSEKGWSGVESVSNSDFKPEKRYVDIDPKNRCVRINGAKQKVASGICTKYGLKIKEIEDLVRANEQMDNENKMSNKDFLIHGRKPLLLLHFMSIHCDAKKNNEEKHPINKAAIESLQEQLHKRNTCLVALGVAIPHDKSGNGTEKVRYVINKVKLQQLQEEIEELDSYDD